MRVRARARLEKLEKPHPWDINEIFCKKVSISLQIGHGHVNQFFIHDVYNTNSIYHAKKIYVPSPDCLVVCVIRQEIFFSEIQKLLSFFVIDRF